MIEDEENPRNRWRSTAASALLIVGILAWLWPIGLGGRMPVGGDVTQFSIGLMAELGRAIRAGRIPYWNDLWGFGFPGLAESQMGVYYPPHLLLYGLLPVEVAYTVSLVAHSVWSGLGASWAARRFGASRRGATLSGFAFATSGFFLVHLPHQWGATTASWMPWAWGLAWSTGRGDGGRRSTLILAAVLAIQVLPGHFQLAFITEVTTAVIGLSGLIAGGVSGRRRRLIGLILATISVMPMSLAQLGPTAELARLAGSQRSVDYLSAFATPPIHLVSYVAPGLFHESPLWRPLAWDAFHAMPEEHRATVGLVPLFLAIVGLWAGRRDSRCRTLGIVALLATYFSLGPYVPGFSALCHLPGFSYFRAPSRWGAAAMLAMAILAGVGFDAISGLSHPGRAIRRFVSVAAIFVIGVVSFFELAITANEPTSGRPAWPSVSLFLDRAFRLLPWDDEPRLSVRIAEARRSLDDGRVAVALARQGLPSADPADRTLIKRRVSIYLRELGPTGALLAALAVASCFVPRSPRTFVMALLLILIAEALLWSHRRPIDLGPIRPLTAQSDVLGQLAELPRGTRSVDPMRNLAMVAGSAPIDAYRTLDLPVQPGLVRMATDPTARPESAPALRAIGAGVSVTMGANLRPIPGWDRVEVVHDPTLAGWLSGTDWTRSIGVGASSFVVVRPSTEPSRAWFVSSSADELAKADDPRSVLRWLSGARPLPWKASMPEGVILEIETNRAGVAVLTQLDYPRWRASLSGQSVPIVRVFGGWQGVAVPGSGRWTVRLDYDTRPDRACLAVSGLAWAAWGLLYWRAGRRRAVAVLAVREDKR